MTACCPFEYVALEDYLPDINAACILDVLGSNIMFSPTRREDVIQTIQAPSPCSISAPAFRLQDLVFLPFTTALAMGTTIAKSVAALFILPPKPPNTTQKAPEPVKVLSLPLAMDVFKTVEKEGFWMSPGLTTWQETLAAMKGRRRKAEGGAHCVEPRVF